MKAALFHEAEQTIKDELGRAWLSAFALLPPDWTLEIRMNDLNFVTALAKGPNRGRGRAAFFEMTHAWDGNAAEALWALAEQLRARP